MRDLPQLRPGRVVVTAWSFIIAGLGKVVGLPLFLWPLRDEAAFLSSDSLLPSLSPAWLARSAGFVVGHLQAFLACWMLLGFFMIVAAVHLQRRRAWARVGLEAVCWFGVLEAPLVAAFIYSVRRMLLRPGVAGGDSLAASLVSRFWASLAWLGIYVVLLILLKRTHQGDRAHGQAEGESQGAYR